MTQRGTLGSHFTRLRRLEYSDNRLIPCFIFIISILSCLTATADSQLIEVFVERAQQQKLAKHPTWLALLHYKDEVFSKRFISQADDDAFFLAAGGRVNPEAELKAGLRGMLADSSMRHAQCRFPARWHWLKGQLSISDDYDVACPRFDKWLSQLGTDSLSLVFPSMYLGNPGSSFGHTFLRFDSTDPVLLSHALNYAAANKPEDNSLAYVYRGVFGGYNGVFALRRYFETVQLYSDMENRDIWEYRLAYTPQQIKQLARHVWELNGIQFDYYFVRENCSYRLMTMLDVVTDNAPLSTGESFSSYAIPVDTVRALESHNLIAKRQYRPSLATRLETGFNQLDDAGRKAVLQLIDSQSSISEVLSGFESQARQAECLQLAYSLLQFRGQDQSERAAELLLARSRFEVPPQTFTATPHPPEQGHETARVSLGAGRQNGLGFTELALRQSFHDLLDSPIGYIKGSAINALDVGLRWFPELDQIRLDKLGFINLVSLAPVTDWARPLSWQLDIKLENTPFTPTDNSLVFVTRAGVGYSGQYQGALFYSMAMMEVDIADEYRKGYSLLTGGEIGVLVSSAANRFKLQYAIDDAIAGHDSRRYTAEAQLQFDLSSSIALRLMYRQQRYNHYRNEESLLSLKKYF